MYGFIFIYTKLNNKHLHYLSIKRINLVLLLSDSENTDGGKQLEIFLNPPNPNKSNVKSMKNYLCSAEHSQ